MADFKEIVHQLKMLNPKMDVAGAIRFYEHFIKPEITRMPDQNDICKTHKAAGVTCEFCKVGCGKKIMVKENGAQHQSFCGCTYKGLHLCEECDAPKQEGVTQ